MKSIWAKLLAASNCSAEEATATVVLGQPRVTNSEVWKGGVLEVRTVRAAPVLK